MIIKNRDKIAKTEYRSHVLDIIEAGIQRVLPNTIVRNSIHYYSEDNKITVEGDIHRINGRIFVVGAGKASGQMAEVLESIFGEDMVEFGIVNCVDSVYNTKKIKIFEASHPTPDERGVMGVNEMLKIKDRYNLNESDIVICLLSGGGSSLLPSPVDGVLLEDKQEITRLLLNSGAEIHEINSVRKHLSKVKGGGLGNYFKPAKVISLILSDVIGNDLDVIASGPTVNDKSTIKGALRILKKYNLLDTAPKRIIDYFNQNMEKINDYNLDNCKNYLIGDTCMALDAMERKAKDLGYKPYIISSEESGDPTVAAHRRAEEIISGKYPNYDLLLIGGETNPKIPSDHGAGGRNQQYVLSSLKLLNEYDGDFVLASVGSDGRDYIPDVAGAIIDRNTFDHVTRMSLELQSFVDRYDSYTLFKLIGKSLIRTGNTGTNVGDIVVYLLK